MKIRCENCATEHSLDPPAWVLSSGRPFRFRCASCGHSQMVSAETQAEAVPTASEEPAPTPPTPLEQPPATPLKGMLGSTLSPAEESSPESNRDTVYIKQDGTVYLVRDWATLQRWIMERRVGREDLVSEGGVRWEPIGGRPELMSFFRGVELIEAAELEADTHLMSSLGGETPFDPEPAPTGDLEDDPVGGIPTGLPPLPTEELRDEGEAGPDYPVQPPARGVWSPEPEGDATAALAESRLPVSDELEDDPFSAELELPEPVVASAEEPPDDSEDYELGEAPAPEEPVETPDLSPPALLETPQSAPPRFEEDVPTLAPSLIADSAGEPELSEDPFADYGVEEEETPTVLPAPQLPQESWMPPWLWAFLIAATLAAVGLVIWFISGGLEREPPRPQTPEAPLSEVLPAPQPETPAAEAPADEEPADEAPADEAPAAEDPAPEAPADEAPEPLAPEPRVVAAPAPATPPPPRAKPAPGPSVGTLIDRGWTAVDANDLGRAMSQFTQALAKAPGNPDAHFGYGYVLLQQGDTAKARTHLCEALARAADPELHNEARGVLEGADLSCP